MTEDQPKRTRGTERAKLLNRSRRKYLYVVGASIVSLLCAYGLIETPELAGVWLGVIAAALGQTTTALKNLSDE